MDPTQLQPGYRLDRYELLCPLAYGGMASVWLARFGGRLGFERMVVIKMILPQYSQDPRFQEMFLDEARIASKIEHTNVARILDVGEHQDNYFIVMDWVDGDSLSKILRASEQRNERVPSGVALRICADAAAGLHAAHELKERDGTHLGVVHRDVSPQNILVANNGTTVIIDFGVAKARDRVSQETSAGQLKGKIRYMAPEQALGQPIDHRADVWAIGTMLYEMFTGQAPYDGPNEVATLHKLTSGQRPPPLPSTIPEALRVVVDRALGYEPDQRFSTALELNQALERAMVEIKEPTTAASVAHYTGHLLADRKSARKRAVDTALEAARQREILGAHSSTRHVVGPPSSAVAFPPPAPSSQRAFGPPYAEMPSAISTPSAPGGGLGELPSGTSSTLGSAAMEYLPERMPVGGARRRRYFAAAALGVSVAAGVVGMVLIIHSAVMRHVEPKAATAPPPTEGPSLPPAVAADPDPAADPPTPTTPTTAAPVPAAPPTAATPTPTPTASTARGDTPRPIATVPPHKPPVVTPPPVSKSKPTPPRPDRGF